MEISSEIKSTSVSTSQNTETDKPRLQEGASITAEIKNIKKDQVTLKLENGQTLTANVKGGTVQAGVGEVQNFTVHYENGKLTLELKQQPIAQMQKNAIMDLLMSLGLKPSPENLKKALALLDNQLPINKDNLQKLNQSMKLLGVEIGSKEISKATFFLKNDVPITAKNAEAVNNYSNGNTKILNQLENILKSVAQMPDGALKQNLLKALSGETQATTTSQPQSSQSQTAQTTQAPQAQQNTTPQTTATAQIVQTPTAAETIAKTSTETPTIKPEIKPETVSKFIAENPELAKKMSEAIKNNMPIKDTINLLKAELLKAEPQAQGELKETLKQALREIAKDSPEQLKLLEADEFFTEEASMKQDTKSVETRRSEIFENIRQKLRFNPENSNPKDIDKFLNELKEKIEAATQELHKNPSASNEKLLKEFTSIKENLEFTNHMKNNVFLQLPIVVHNHPTNGEIFIFNNKNNQKKSGNANSALVALDTVSMGRFEVYVQKQGRAVHCQFRLRDENVEKLVKANTAKLKDLLGSFNFTLESCSYKKLEEPFTLISEQTSILQQENSTSQNRMAFDYRT